MRERMSEEEYVKWFTAGCERGYLNALPVRAAIQQARVVRVYETDPNRDAKWPTEAIVMLREGTRMMDVLKSTTDYDPTPNLRSSWRRLVMECDGVPPCTFGFQPQNGLVQGIKKDCCIVPEEFTLWMRGVFRHMHGEDNEW